MAAVGGSWISWSGGDREVPRQGDPLPERLTLPVGERTCALRRIPLSERESSLYYYGFACRTVWPLMHLHLGRVQFDPEAWRAYRRVNQRFAYAVVEVYEPGDRIWVHDFHLSLVPSMLRHALPNALAPIITVVVLNLAYLIVGVVVVEVVFVYPGIGQLMVDNVAKRDLPVVQACGLVFAGTYTLLNMIADILATLANPRLRHPK